MFTSMFGQRQYFKINDFDQIINQISRFVIAIKLVLRKVNYSQSIFFNPYVWTKTSTQFKALNFSFLASVRDQKPTTKVFFLFLIATKKFGWHLVFGRCFLGSGWCNERNMCPQTKFPLFTLETRHKDYTKWYVCIIKLVILEKTHGSENTLS